jgi:hypothetical protein
MDMARFCTLFARPIRLFVGMLAGVCTAAVADDTFPPVTAEEVLARQAQSQGQWMSRLPESGPRLFYTEEDWGDIRVRLSSAAGRMPELRRLLFRQADEIVREPVPEYHPPEFFLEDMTLREANEELWIRRVGDSLVALSLAAQLSDDPKYSMKLHQIVLAGCSYETWGRSQSSDTDNNMSLAAGDMARGVAIAYDWHRGLFSGAERQFICDTMRERCNDLLRGVYGEAGWAASYQVNHNQVSVAGLGIAGAAFLGELPEAGEWLAAAIVNFEYVMQFGNADGGSIEGVPYWTYGLAFILQFIEAIKGVADVEHLYESPFLKNAASFRIGMATPDLAGIVPFGDAPTIDHYGPQNFLYLMADIYDNPSAQYLANRIPFQARGGRDIPAWVLLWYNPDLSEDDGGRLDYHADVWDVVTTRSGWGTGAYMLALKSGFTNRNHSHLDAGSLAFCFGDEWLLKLPGYGNFYGESNYWDTRGPRWDYYVNSTEAESTLLINGQRNQKFDPEARGLIDAFFSSEDSCWFRVDLTGAYEDVDQVERWVIHQRGKYILVLDKVRADESISVEWLAQAGADPVCDGRILEIPCATGSLIIQLLGGNVTDFYRREPTSPRIDADQIRSYASSSEGEEVYFAVLMQPVFTDHPAAALSADFALAEDGTRTVTVNSDQWKDTVVIAPYQVSIKLDSVSNVPDSDADGLADAWEIENFGNLDQGPAADPDCDGLTNLEEQAAGANPLSRDTDGDFFEDDVEVAHGMNPAVADSELFSGVLAYVRNHPDTQSYHGLYTRDRLGTLGAQTLMVVDGNGNLNLQLQLWQSPDLEEWTKLGSPEQRVFSIDGGRRIFYQWRVGPAQD